MEALVRDRLWSDDSMLPKLKSVCLNLGGKGEISKVKLAYR